MGREGVKLPLPLPCLKLIRIMAETSNFVHIMYTQIYSIRKCTIYCQDPLNFADVTIFLGKSQHLLAEIVPLLKAIV